MEIQFEPAARRIRMLRHLCHRMNCRADELDMSKVKYSIMYSIV